ncbi:MAG: HPP family protein [Saprospiraceae bacterium]
MNVIAPVSSIMSTQLLTVNAEDNLNAVSEIFKKHQIHHIPVVAEKQILGIISYSDFSHFVKGMDTYEEKEVKMHRLLNTKAADIMTKGLAKLEPDDRIDVAVNIFKDNRFHALPVVKDDELVGIVTTHDIIQLLADEKILDEYYKMVAIADHK